MKSSKFSLLATVLCLSAAWSGSSVLTAAETNTKCPIMTDSDADPDNEVEYQGVKVGMCCTKCAKLWAKNPAYYIKAAPELLPQFKGQEAKLGLDKITLLPQKFCPMKSANLVCPDSPSTEYKGVKVYFFDQKGLEKWKLDPETNAKRAIAAGLLPQLAGK